MDSRSSTDSAPESASSGCAPHPLFPGEPNPSVEAGEVVYVTFGRRGWDGHADNCPDDYEAEDIRSWADVVRRWGPGDYRVVAKDSRRRVVAVHPPRNDEWVRCGDALSHLGVRSHGPPPPVKRRRLPRLNATSAESIALWATLCARRQSARQPRRKPGRSTTRFCRAAPPRTGRLPGGSSAHLLCARGPARARDDARRGHHRGRLPCSRSTSPKERAWSCGVERPADPQGPFSRDDARRRGRVLLGAGTGAGVVLMIAEPPAASAGPVNRRRGVDLDPPQEAPSPAGRNRTPDVRAEGCELARIGQVEFGTAERTRRQYRKRISLFAGWCAARGVPVVPADPEALAFYVSWLGAKGASWATIRGSHAAILALHRAFGYPAPTSERIRAVLHEVRRAASMASQPDAINPSTLRKSSEPARRTFLRSATVP